VRGIDSDPDAVRVACANAKQNGVFQKVRFSRSGLEEIPLKGGQKYDLICANLVMDLLLDQKARILGRLATGGRLVLAGILRSQLGQIRAEYQKSGLKMDTFKVEREWASVAFVG
jgi:ribosomal protein L11 methyltransferase